MRRLDEHDDGPRKDAGTSCGAAVRTTGVARPDEGRSQSTEFTAALADAYVLLRRIAARAEQLADAA
jgi:hypothetical protein